MFLVMELYYGNNIFYLFKTNLLIITIIREIFTGEIIGDHISEDVLVVEASVLSGER